MLTIVTDSPSRLNAADCYKLVLDNWDYLKGLSFTYRFLSSLLNLDRIWVDTAASRTELVNIIKELSDGWK